ncbi:sulfatase-like hydrolase/transferase [Algisphaera agarilytica]|uniref:Arylsulfatase A-like enzyme n=1 Tax=Algisphaera agarilytica TaxID=1385975 RepID=A0A7X0LJB4_9BACT|nr:sulfatase-like hydrolase/transferase [Algisphaera agarilytica]MBB6429150.1 arylsulfatase A-like enzyme [Algisphaera agarilytica]
MSQPLNVLFLLVDQWPADSFGFRGSSCATPNLDQLKSRSTDFVNAFTTCPLCTPARGALLTGRWPHETGVYDNCGVGYSNQPRMRNETATWLDHAKEVGYRVGYFGKWHLGTDGLKDRGLDGFDDPGEVHTPYDERPGFSYENTKDYYLKHGQQILKQGTAPFWGETGPDAGPSKCGMAVDSGLSFLQQQRDSHNDQPFFLTVSIADPHFPHYLPSHVLAQRDSLDLPYPANFDDDFSNKPAFQNGHWWPCHDTDTLTDNDWKHIFDYALRHREYVDAQIGKLLDALRQSGLEEDTLIVFTSDHGDMCGAHNRFDKGPYFYDEVWRVPLLISMPGVAPCENAEFASLIDLGRYFNRFFGGTNEPTEGLRLEDELGKTKQQPQDSTYAHGVYDMYNGHWFGIRAIRDARHKYVRNLNAVDEFYDLTQDPHELKNLIDTPGYREPLAVLSRQLDEFLEAIDDPIRHVEAWPTPGQVVHVNPYRN